MAKVKQLQHEAELAGAVYEPYDPKNPRKGLSEDNPYERVDPAKVQKELGITKSQLEPTDSKFRAGVFRDQAGNYVVSYKGTGEGFLNNPDWLHNASQGLTGYSDYYNRAKSIAQSAGDSVGPNGVTSVKFVGHSLGGGMASAAAHAANQPATTFNAAGLHIFNRKWFGTAPPIDAVSVKGEVLTTLQRSTDLPEAVGEPYELAAPKTSVSGASQAAKEFGRSLSVMQGMKGYVSGAIGRSVELHKMPAVTQALKNKREELEGQRDCIPGCSC